MREFLTCDSDDWKLPYARWPDVFRPNSLPFERLPGPEYRGKNGTFRILFPGFFGYAGI
jgi:hypothetical protein